MRATFEDKLIIKYETNNPARITPRVLRLEFYSIESRRQTILKAGNYYIVSMRWWTVHHGWQKHRLRVAKLTYVTLDTPRMYPGYAKSVSRIRGVGIQYTRSRSVTSSRRGKHFYRKTQQPQIFQQCRKTFNAAVHDASPLSALGSSRQVFLLARQD